MSIDINSLTPAELQQFQRDAQAHLDKIARDNADNAKRDVIKYAAERGFKIQFAETGTKPPRSSLPVTHRDTDGIGTWTGRGKRPKWLQAHVLAGRAVDEFRV